MLCLEEWDQLLLSARAGDVQALERLLDVASEDLRAAAAGVLRRTPRSRGLSEDVYADAMVAVLRDIGSLRATNYVGFRFWFASIARNNLHRTLRNERSCLALSSQAVETRGDADATRKLSSENEDFLRRAMLRMPSTQQVAFVLREGLALTWRTIGFVLDRREPPAARLVHYRAIQGVKELAQTIVAGRRPESVL